MAANQLPIEMELVPQAGLIVPNGLNVPNGLHVPNDVHEQPAAPAPEPGVCGRYRNWLKLLFVFLLILGLFIGGWFIGSRNSHRHYPYYPSFKCEQATIVALDGSGNHTSISRAVDMAPSLSYLEYCIYIKAGVYKENIVIDNTKVKMVLIGEGIGRTIVVGGNISSRVTIEVLGDGFIARDISFKSLLPPTKNVAAAYISGDKCVFYRCKFQGRQSALVVNFERQFFRDCTISGSTAVISGGATTFFQNCTILVGRPIGKDNIISLQGGNSTRTGFVFQSCRILSWNDTGVALQNTFIASPSGHYSRVVVLRSYMAGMIDPLGWITANGTSLVYAEFQNSGPGSVTSRRLHAPGIKTLSHSEASKFTIKHILEYDEEWIESTGIPYWGGLV